MEYQTILQLQKYLYLNFYLFLTWAFVTIFFLINKLNALGHLTKYLTITVFLLLIFIESAKLLIGNFGNLSSKLNALGHLTKYLTITVFLLLIFIESAKLLIGNFGNLYSKVPELAGFLMLTVLLQMPLVTYFLFNPYLMSTPTELTLHAMLWLITLTEIIYGFQSLKQASNYAKDIYLCQSRNK